MLEAKLRNSSQLAGASTKEIKQMKAKINAQSERIVQLEASLSACQEGGEQMKAKIKAQSERIVQLESQFAAYQASSD